MSHVATPSHKPSFRTPWRVGDTVVDRGNAGWTTPKSGHPCPYQSFSEGPSAEKTGKGSLLNRPSCPPVKVIIFSSSNHHHRKTFFFSPNLPQTDMPKFQYCCDTGQQLQYVGGKAIGKGNQGSTMDLQVVQLENTPPSGYC